MPRRLLDLRMTDGSRHFGGLPERYDVASPEWHRLRDHVGRLEGAVLTGFETDEITEAWIDFTYAGQQFSINNQAGEWWFFVADPGCADAPLEQVLDHFEALLTPASLHARRAGPLAPGSLRAVVYEPDGRIACRDFVDPAQARRYADDAASEREDGPVLAYVVDETLRVVHVGRHY